jgi:hypothetical protein
MYENPKTNFNEVKLARKNAEFRLRKPNLCIQKQSANRSEARRVENNQHQYQKLQNHLSSTIFAERRN